jgi:hypothetical protein
MCSSCHGEVGEGGLGPKLQNSRRSRSTLALIIDLQMPADDPSGCDRECADKISDFIHDGLNSDALACDEVGPSPRRLRLLKRREYYNTVRDLFGIEAGEPTHSFEVDLGTQQAQSVHVAGSFNGWAGTLADGGWPLMNVGGNRWAATLGVPAGHHTYKFVIDESDWIADPGNPNTEGDGVGGVNSVIDVAEGLKLNVPVETRPEGYPFDNDATAALVTSPHVDAYVSAAESVATSVGSGLSASKLVDELGVRIFRRPLTSEEKSRYQGIASSDGVEVALQAMMVSPNFLYRSEIGKRTDAGDYKLTDYEMAAALSYMFWATTPDQELLDAAGRGELSKAEDIEKQARRLLADPRSRRVVGDFAVQWLGAEQLDTATKSANLFPEYSPQIKDEMVANLRQLVDSTLFESGGQFHSLYTSRQPTSKVLDGFLGAGGERNAGILSHPAILAAYAHSDQTSPIRRGLFVRRRLLCQELPPPPPNAGAVPEVDPSATTRERFAQHTENAFCASCHQYIDGLGFGFEGFDAVGKYRSSEAGQPIDTRGELRDIEGLGSDTRFEFDSLAQLGAELAASDAAQSCFVRQMVRFSRGYRETLADRCARLDLEQRFARADGEVGELMVEIAVSKAFRRRR